MQDFTHRVMAEPAITDCLLVAVNRKSGNTWSDLCDAFVGLLPREPTCSQAARSAVKQMVHSVVGAAFRRQLLPASELARVVYADPDNLRRPGTQTSSLIQDHYWASGHAGLAWTSSGPMCRVCCYAVPSGSC